MRATPQIPPRHTHSCHIRPDSSIIPRDFHDLSKGATELDHKKFRPRPGRPMPTPETNPHNPAPRLAAIRPQPRPAQPKRPPGPSRPGPGLRPLIRPPRRHHRLTLARNSRPSASRSRRPFRRLQQRRPQLSRGHPHLRQPRAPRRRLSPPPPSARHPAHPRSQPLLRPNHPLPNDLTTRTSHTPRAHHTARLTNRVAPAIDSNFAGPARRSISGPSSRIQPTNPHPPPNQPRPRPLPSRPAPAAPQTTRPFSNIAEAIFTGPPGFDELGRSIKARSLPTHPDQPARDFQITTPANRSP